MTMWIGLELFFFCSLLDANSEPWIDTRFLYFPGVADQSNRASQYERCDLDRRARSGDDAKNFLTYRTSRKGKTRRPSPVRPGWSRACFNEVAAVMLRKTAGPLSHDRNLHSEGGRER